MFEHCQVEADESVIRKEKIYARKADGALERTGTKHHSVIVLTQRGSTKQVLYLCDPQTVQVDSRGKPSPPPPPSTALVLPLVSKHFGECVVLHTDGADAYRQAVVKFQEEGFAVVHDSVNHSKGQYTAFGRHVPDEGGAWDGCEMVLTSATGERRIRVVKGVQKAEGFWRHVKHDDAGIPPEVHNDDARLNLYCQALVWRMQVCGCPVREVMRMCKAFRHLPLEKKNIVFKYGLRDESKVRDHQKSKPLCLTLPAVTYTKWHLHVDDEDSDAHSS